MSKVKTLNTYVGFDKRSSEGLWLRSWNESTGITNVRQTYHTLSGQRWDQLSKRCKVGSTQQNRSECYHGARNEFGSFQEFVDWSVEEVGYKLKDESTGNYWSLDKDILGGNRVYSGENCLFVPNKVNLFVAFRKPKENNLPVGCHYSMSRNKYVAQINVNGKIKNLGGYSTPIEAHRAWQKQKVILGRKLIEDYKFHYKLYEGFSNLINKMEKQYLDYEETL